MVSTMNSRGARHARQAIILPIVLFTACSPSSTSTPQSATCAAPGEPAPGPADTHCGTMVQSIEAASCHAIVSADDGGGDDGGASCPYGDTMWGGEAPDAAAPMTVEGDDDDCKYHIAWTHSEICEGSAGVNFTFTLTSKVDGSKVTGAKPIPEVFTSPPPDAACGTLSNHLGPNSGKIFQESSSGTYTGSIQFDQAGLWTIRFHFFEDCDDLPSSAHGHAAFYVMVP